MRHTAALFLVGAASCAVATPVSRVDPFDGGAEAGPGSVIRDAQGPGDGHPPASDAEVQEPVLDAQAPVADAQGPMDAVSPVADAACPPGAACPAHPFGTHAPYFPSGVIFPSNHAQAELDAATASFYDRWKAAYLEKACKSGHYRIKTTPFTSTWTISTGHGYGMIITAIMAGHDRDAKTYFDGLYAYFKDHPSSVNRDLMAWAQNVECKDVEGVDSATEGDLDIAYALLLADRQWGSDSGIDYLAEGRRVIAAILKSDVHKGNSIMVGDWAGDDERSDGTRPSDYAMNHLKAFSRASGQARWNVVLDKAYRVIAALQDSHAPATGLLPNYAVNAPTDSPRPAPAKWLENEHDGEYTRKACRIPWRIPTDYLMSGDARSQAVARRMNDWMRKTTGGDPAKILNGYKLNGSAIGTKYELAFAAPFAVSAMVEPASGSNQEWLDKLWDSMAGQPISNFYGDSIKMMAMLVASGNWWAP